MGLAALVRCNPAIEVVLATWNGDAYLQAQLESIAAQQVRPTRVLVRDDGSSDGTLEVLQRWQRQWPHWLDLLPAHHRLGSTGNFQALLEATDGPYVALADQDDLWDADKLQRGIALMQRLEERHGTDTPLLVHSDLRLIDAEGHPLAPSFLDHQGLDPQRCDSDSLVLQNVVTGCSCLINRALITQALPFPQGITQHDHWLALVAARTGVIGFIDAPLLSYRQHGRNSIGATGDGLLYLVRRFTSMGSHRSPLRRLNAALTQAIALQQRCPGPPLALVEFATASPLQRWRHVGSRRLRKHGWKRQLGLLLLLPWLTRRRAIASMD